MHDARTDAHSALIDVSHVVEDGMVTYRGLPAPIICDFLSRADSRARYSPGTEFHIGRIDMVTNTGTYVDAPFHRFADGRDLAALPLEALADVEAIVVRCRHRGARAIDADVLGDLDVRGRAVLFDTGWDAHWRTDRYFEGHPFLTARLAERLRRGGARIVGIDSFNIDDVDDGSRPVHTELLGAEIPIVEHMRGVDRLPDRGFSFFAVPVKVAGMGTFPVRAFGRVP